MSSSSPRTVASITALFVCAAAAHAQDWPQWRGPGRDARVPFDAPETWPEELTAGWKVEVGDGVATPALVGDRLYVFARQGENEVLRCLDAASGEELWKDEVAVAGADGAARRYAGPRSSPTVAEGKVVTLGVRGLLSCYDAASGELAWRKTGDAWPRFYTSCSPIVLDGVCIAQVGSEDAGAVVAYDLASGEEKWSWAGGGTAYSSPVLWATGDATTIVAETADSVVGLDATDGTLLWQTPFVVRGRGYNAATPIVGAGGLVLTGSGRGTRLASLHEQDEGWAVEERWANEEHSVQYNTPVIVGDFLYGLSDGDDLFCVELEGGATRWSTGIAAAQAEEEEGGGRGRGRGGRGGFGSIVVAGDVLMALSPAGELVVFEPNGAEYEELARYRVGDGTHAYPVVSGRRIFVKDQDSVALWTLGAGAGD